MGFRYLLCRRLVFKRDLFRILLSRRPQQKPRKGRKRRRVVVAIKSSLAYIVNAVVPSM